MLNILKYFFIKNVVKTFYEIKSSSNKDKSL